MKNYIFLAMICYSAATCGQDVSQTLAVDIATQYYERVKNDNPGEHISRIRTNNQTRSDRYPELISPLGLADMWLVPVDDGWVLVSSNTKTTPILAHYQTDRKPVYDLLAPGEKYLLDWYEHEIAYANDSCPTCERNSKWDILLQEKSSGIMWTRSTPVVPPLTQTHWDQTGNNSKYPVVPYCDKSYNKFCKTINNAPDQCNRAAAGCGAVAIAQILAYWKWPYGASVPTTSGGNTYDYKFYDWTKMPNMIFNYTPDLLVDNVAGLLLDCGYHASTTYGEQSFAFINNVKDAFVACGYDDTTINIKDKWTTSGWQAMLQAEIDLGRPVCYRGFSNDIWFDGHYFVLDGYDSTGKFHINFGWCGSEDNFYYVDSIFANSTNFNHWQSAIVGIQPDPYCGSGTILNILTTLPKFNYTIGGEMLLNNNVMEDVEHGELFSATQVRMTGNVHIKSGCNVHIAIKDVPCQSVSSNAPAFQSTSSSEDDGMQNISDITTTAENSCVQKFFRNGQLLILRDGKTYNVTGMEVE